MMNAVENTLPNFGIAKERIHTERFHTGKRVNVVLKQMQTVKKKK